MAGDSPATLERITALYKTIIKAGVYPVKAIVVAEAAKVIENTQRDLNIALMNELAIIFDRLGIDTTEVLEAARTKWNFLEFQPGLVGGHCIGVDPYFLTYKAEMLGYQPQVILSGRRINDSMGKFIAEKTVKLMIRSGIDIKKAKVNVLGITFKENCPVLRNSKVVDVIRELTSYGVQVRVHDPIADKQEAKREVGLSLVEWNQLESADAIVLAVAHDHYREMGWQRIGTKLAPGGCLVDVKAIIPKRDLDGITFWRL